MTAILYPVAADGQAALDRPLGRASRATDAQKLAGEPVSFVTESVGPAFATREAALAAYPGRFEEAPAEDRFCRLSETVAPGAKPPKRLKPAMAGGRRWPSAPPAPPPTVWRLTVSYWRLSSAIPADLPQARQARRSDAGLDREALAALANQPLRPVKAQQALDIGLFEARLPESPDIVVPDE